MRVFIVCTGLALAGCGITPTQQATLITAGQTLADVAAASNTTVAALVTGGQLFCSGAAGIVAVTDPAGATASVIGQTSAAVAKVCHDVDGIAVPVSPPIAAAAVPAVVVRGALAASGAAAS